MNNSEQHQNTVNALKLIKLIADPVAACPTACPNSENKPINDMCGLYVCLEQIAKVAAAVMRG